MAAIKILYIYNKNTNVKEKLMIIIVEGNEIFQKKKNNTIIFLRRQLKKYFNRS